MSIECGFDARSRSETVTCRDAAVLDYRSDGEGVSVVSPDGSRVEASSFELREFAVCRGLN